MDRVVETEGDTVEAAVGAALEQLGATKNEVHVDVLEEDEGGKGLFGRKRAGKARVRVSLAANPEVTLKDTAERVLELLDLRGSVSVSRGDEETIQVDVLGEDDLGILIGRHGQTLEALQTILGVIVNRASADRVRVTLDIEEYRQRRREELTELAERVAGKAVATGEPVVLRPMTPFERKVVHTALSDNPDVETFSEGEEPYRRITVEPSA